MIRSSFQLTPGVGSHRERLLWEAGCTGWDLFGPARPLPRSCKLSPSLRERLCAAVAVAREHLAAGDAEALAAMLPCRERWRLYAAFAPDAAFLDIETDGGDTVTAVGVLDREGPRIFLRGRDLPAFLERAESWKLLVTYNGLSFDVPVLERTFPAWRPPRAHVDLRHLWARLGHRGGLKLLEAATGVGRPAHLCGLDGLAAVRLWRLHEEGDPRALRLLAEYNLYDAVNLKALMALGYNRMLSRLSLPGAEVEPWHRGDALYDISKTLLAL